MFRQVTSDSQGLMENDSLDFRGATCTGKTSILTHIVAHTILPQVWTIQFDGQPLEVMLNGLGRSVVFIDLDLQFSVNRLYSMTLNRVTEAIEQCPIDVKTKLIGRDEEIHKLVLDSLARCHTFRISTIGDLSNTIFGMSRWLHQHPDENIQYVMMDSISSVLWDKRDSANNHHKLYGSHAENIFNHITSTLRKLQAQWNFVVCTTTRKIAANASDEVPLCWSKYWTFRVELRRFDSDLTNPLADYQLCIVRSARANIPMEPFQRNITFRYAIKDNDVIYI
ncbi:hypothetical protein BGW37DRAFT_494770 [Umbelopsis sp. PMI_123]|nr:hypothetical protein BGW37DRAFT_494770 [Umbelopsis sp. PMI_123]